MREVGAIEYASAASIVTSGTSSIASAGYLGGMTHELLRTSNSAPLAVVRLGLGLVMFAHGAQKMLGWFGGAGFNGTMGFFGQIGIPGVFAFLAIAAEFFGGLGLIFGFLTRIAAFGVMMNMLVAIFKVH